MHINTTTLNYGGNQPQETIITLRHTQHTTSDFLLQICLTQIELLNQDTTPGKPWIRVIDTRSDIRITPDRISIAGAKHLTGNVILCKVKIGRRTLKALYQVIEQVMSQQVKEQHEKIAQENRA